MSYLPPPAKLTALDFALEYTAVLGATTWQRTDQYVVVWPTLREVRLCVPGPPGGLRWQYLFTGPVADEAAFDALVAQHFPELTP